MWRPSAGITGWLVGWRIQKLVKNQIQTAFNWVREGGQWWKQWWKNTRHKIRKYTTGFDNRIVTPEEEKAFFYSLILWCYANDLEIWSTLNKGNLHVTQQACQSAPSYGRLINHPSVIRTVHCAFQRIRKGATYCVWIQSNGSCQIMDCNNVYLRGLVISWCIIVALHSVHSSLAYSNNVPFPLKRPTILANEQSYNTT